LVVRRPWKAALSRRPTALNVAAVFKKCQQQKAFSGLSHFPLLDDVGGSSPLPPATAEPIMRTYQASVHPPVAVAHASVVIRSTTGVGASAHAI
jgi:hypothetical protein